MVLAPTVQYLHVYTYKVTTLDIIGTTAAPNIFVGNANIANSDIANIECIIIGTCRQRVY